ncbi:hypothetical protein BX666DRAFT_2030198 [Dichotomocladium elegans]|nr:hypothetical protein BX666DRAFT_2030198 [Dichotomocladium elegans]
MTVLLVGISIRTFYRPSKSDSFDPLSMTFDRTQKQESEETLPRYVVSKLAVGYHKGCEKLLKNYGRREEKGTSPPLRLKAAQTRGNEYEKKLARSLGMALVDHTGTPYQESKSILCNAQAGQVLYQLRFMVPVEVQQELFPSYRLGEYIPDFLLIKKEPGSNVRKICVVDAKSSETINSHHQFQVATYAFLIAHLIQDVDNLEVDPFGGVWLQNMAEPTYFRVDLMLGKIERFYTAELPAIVSNPAPKWLYGPKCITCGYADRCRREAYGTPGAIAYLDPEILDAIHAEEKEKDANYAVDIEDLMDGIVNLSLNVKKEPAIPRYLSKRPEYAGHDAAYRTGKPQESVREFFAANPIYTLARVNDHEIFLTAIHDPSKARLCSYSLMTYDARTGKFVEDLIGTGHVGQKGTPDEYLAMYVQLVRDLDMIMSQMEAIQSRCTIFFPSAFIKDCARRAIFNVVAAHHSELVDDTTARKGQRCLLVLFQSTCTLDIHDIDTSLTCPEDKTTVPITCNIDAVVRRNVILGVPGFYTDEDLVEWLFPFKSPTPPNQNTLYCTWVEEKRDETLKMLVLQAITYQEVICSVKAMANEFEISTSSEIYCLDNQPFRWPQTRIYRSPVLAKLAIFTIQESIAAYEKVRANRYNDMDGKIGSLNKGLKLKYLGYDEDGVSLQTLTDIVSASFFDDYLLVPDDKEGILQAIRFPDMLFKKQLFVKTPVTIATIESTEENGKIFVLSGYMKRLKLVRGHQYRLYKRYTNYFVDKIMDVLSTTNDQNESVFEDIIRDPNIWSVSAHPDKGISADVKNEALTQAKSEFQMSDSQCRIAANIIERRLQIIWGPPGSGKTEFLALFLNWYIKYLARPCPGARHYLIGVTALTRLAIQNLLERIAKVREKIGIEFPIISMASSDAVRGGQGIKDIKIVEPRKIKAEVAALTGPVLIGGTVWDWAKVKKAWNEWGGLDCLVIDEASQLLVSDSIVGIDCLAKERGRLVVAGDHLQLGPILHASYPAFSSKEPRLFGSIQDCLMRTCENESIEMESMIRRKAAKMDFGPSTIQLTDNWRMNGGLNAFFAQIYGDEYQSKFPCQTLHNDWSLWKGAQKEKELMERIFDHNQCITIVKVPEDEPDIEARSISRILEAYLTTKVPNNTGKDPRYDAMIIAPHHWKRIAVKRELNHTNVVSGRVMVQTVEKMQGQECDLTLECGFITGEVIIVTTEYMLSLASQEGYNTRGLFEQGDGLAFVGMIKEWALKSKSIVDWEEFDN